MSLLGFFPHKKKSSSEVSDHVIHRYNTYWRFAHNLKNNGFPCKVFTTNLSGDPTTIVADYVSDLTVLKVKKKYAKIHNFGDDFPMGLLSVIDMGVSVGPEYPGSDNPDVHVVGNNLDVTVDSEDILAASEIDHFASGAESFLTNEESEGLPDAATVSTSRTYMVVRRNVVFAEDAWQKRLSPNKI